MPVRENRITSGDLFEVMLGTVPYIKRKGKRARKKKITTPKQKVLNDVHAKRHLHRLIEANFTKGDLVVHLTYDDKNLPTSLEEGKKHVRNFLRRMKYHWDKKGLGKFKYIYITEYADDEGKGIRIHHHLVVSDGLDRKIVEGLWKYGYRNTSQLQPNDRGLEKLAEYLSKSHYRKSERKYTPSQNLEKPIVEENNHKYSKKKLEQLASYGEDDSITYEKLYPGYRFLGCKITRNEHTGGTYIYIRMRKLRI